MEGESGARQGKQGSSDSGTQFHGHLRAPVKTGEML
jgi:hypothetical protein